MSGERCETCGDVAAPMVVLAVDPADRTAVCREEGGRRVSVDTGIVGPVAAGETLLVHAGTALVRQAGGRREPA